MRLIDEKKGWSMSEEEGLKCPKCGGEMEKGARITGYLTIAVRFTKKSDLKGDMIIPFYCTDCGYIELYKEMKQKKDCI